MHVNTPSPIDSLPLAKLISEMRAQIRYSGQVESQMQVCDMGSLLLATCAFVSVCLVPASTRSLLVTLRRANWKFIIARLGAEGPGKLMLLSCRSNR